MVTLEVANYANMSTDIKMQIEKIERELYEVFNYAYFFGFTQLGKLELGVSLLHS